MTTSETPTLKTLRMRLVDVAHDHAFIVAAMDRMAEARPRDDEKLGHLLELHAETLFQLIRTSALLDAEAIKVEGRDWPDSPETRAYLVALRTIVAHLEGITQHEVS